MIKDLDPGDVKGREFTDFLRGLSEKYGAKITQLHSIELAGEFNEDSLKRAISLSGGVRDERLMSLNRTFQTAQKILELISKTQLKKSRVPIFDDPGVREEPRIKYQKTPEAILWSI